jgi:epoxyqueuosine reductase QueG
MINLEDSIRRIFDENSVAIFGFADLNGILDEDFLSYTHAISFAVKLNTMIVDSIATGPNQEYCDAYKSVNNELDRISSLIESEFTENGYKALSIPASKRTDYKQIRGEFPHKTAATRAGIGWIGRSSLLVTKRNGPRIRLSTILTDYPLKANSPIEKNYCGKCTECIQMCPAGAIVGGGWEPGIEREKLIDVYKCDKWKKEMYSEYCGGRVCGICVSVCPFGKRGSKKKR